MTAPVLSLAEARAKRVKRSVNVGTMSARVLAGRVQFLFDKPVGQFHLSPAQARFWARCLLTLADSAAGCDP